MSFDFEPVYPHHDLLIELAQVEMAMDRLSGQGGDVGTTSRPVDLESRMSSLREALNQLPV